MRLTVRSLVLCALLAAALCALPAVASAQSGFPIFDGFHSVLAFGEGQGTSAAGLALFEANGAVPASDLSQDKMYEGIEQAWPGFTGADLATYFKNSDFQAQPPESVLSTLTSALGPLTGSPPAVQTPRTGVTIVRDPVSGVPRIYADTRAEGMWAAGYTTAEYRLFFMDVLRHTAEGTTAELLGPSAEGADSAQLGIQDESPAQLNAEVNSLPSYGPAGAQVLSDMQQYVAGINAFIAQTQLDPTMLPAEYPALGLTPKPWTLADSAAVGVYLIGVFTVFGGQQPQQAEALQMARARLGLRTGTEVYDDLRFAHDPGAAVTLPHRFDSDSTGRLNPASVALISPGSLEPRNVITGGPESPPTTGTVGTEQRRASAELPAWARQLALGGLRLPHLESNAVLVDGARSGNGQALAVMGPQVGYYTPEVMFEYELHAPGIDTSGVSFPGASPYPLIGHGTDFAWTGTSAFSDNEDVFAERLCNPDGSKPSFASADYFYKGRCIPFQTGEIVEHTPLSPTSPSVPKTIVEHTLNSVHGPIASYAMVGGTPVALANAAATAGHEVRSYIAFMDLAENVPDSPQSFIQVMHNYTGSENWFYVDDHNIAVYQSGWFPRHARGTDPDLPIWGTGAYDWQGFQPGSLDYQRLAQSANPVSIDPPQGYLVNWNNAIAHGWRVAAGDWSSGPVVRASMLQLDLNLALKHRPLTLPDLVGDVTGPSMTSDLRGMEDWPWLRRVIGNSRNQTVQQLSALLQNWSANGAQRRSLSFGGDVQYGPAVLLMDTWWPLLVRAEFEPELGAPLLDFISANFNRIVPDGLRDGSGNGFFEGWEMDVQQDLRQVLRRHIAGRWSRTYCGGGSLRRCRAIVIGTLLAAGAQLAAKYGSDQANWKLPTLCPVTSPPSCDQIVATAAGALNVPPQPFANRGTFYQAVAISGHR